MNLLFWKKKKPSDSNEEAQDDDRTVAIEKASLPEAAEGAEEASERPGFLTRLAGLFKGKGRDRHAGAELNDAAEGGDEAAADESVEAMMAKLRLKRRLIMGGFIAGGIFLLGAIAAILWAFLASPAPEEHHAASPKPSPKAEKIAEPPHPETPVQTGSAKPDMEQEIEALRKRNEELAAQLQSLKQQQEGGESSPPRPAPGDREKPSAGGEIFVYQGQDAKASAQALKEAIEAMNAASGRPPAATGTSKSKSTPPAGPEKAAH